LSVDKSSAWVAVTRSQETEKSPLLEAVAREQLLKIQQDEKRLSRRCGGD
jgi:hypothetical protein